FKKHGLILDFQNATPFGDDLDRVEYFHNLGVRMVQLTYNLRNLVGDGCNEAHQGGLSYFGREVVRRLNEHRILVDVSHCSEQVGIGTDKAGPGPGTESLVEYPATLPRHDPRKFTWAGFRLEEHRLTSDYHLTGYENFGDWPNLTVKLAERGFNEEELRKLLG